MFKLSSENQTRVTEYLPKILATLSLHQIFFNFFFEIFSSTFTTNLIILYYNFLLTLSIESFTLANIGTSFSVLHALINNIWGSLFIKQLLLSPKGRICFNTFYPCFCLNTCPNILIQAYRFITNKITKSFNMVLVGGTNNSNPVDWSFARLDTCWWYFDNC